MPPQAGGIALRVAGVLGMDDDTRAALGRLEELARMRKVGVAGHFMPDRWVSARLAEMGVVEQVEAADFFRFRHIVIPFCGVTPRERREWEEAGVSLEDFTSPQVRRAQVALGLLKMEGARPLVIGRHDDPETQAIAGGGASVTVLEDTTDTSRLEFAPAFGAVCQTTLSPRRVQWLAQQLRLRWRDARVSFLDTVSPAMIAREEALERLLVLCDRVLIVGDAGESSCEALAETASRRGRPAHIVAGPVELAGLDFPPRCKVALSAGAFATAAAIHAVAAALAGR